VEGPVEAEPRIDVARKFVGLGDDRLQRRADEGVAMRLAAGQGARVAAQEWQVRSEFLAKRHTAGAAIGREGCGILTFRDDRGSRDQKSASDPATPSRSKAKAGERRTRRRAPGGEVGNALRTAYDDTLKESIPPEMLDLLGKLG
jgi:hypothetical protein